jgi:hypothetical protein
VILEDNLEVMLMEMYWLSLRIMRNGLFQIYPQFDTSLSLSLAGHKAEDAVRCGEALIRSAFL